MAYIQLLIFAVAIVLPIQMWFKLGDADYVDTLSERQQRAWGVKLIKGPNGRYYAKPPPPFKRLLVSVTSGLLLALVLTALVRFAIQISAW